jgi:plastocyanin
MSLGYGRDVESTGVRPEPEPIPARIPCIDPGRNGMNRFGIALALVGILSAGTVPAASDEPHERAEAVTGTAARVKIVDFRFRPRRIEVSRGTRVTWRNRGDVAHTTTSRTDLWDSGSLAPGDTFSRVFRNRGTFRYACSIHPDMRGKVIVT